MSGLMLGTSLVLGNATSNLGIGLDFRIIPEGLHGNDQVNILGAPKPSPWKRGTARLVFYYLPGKKA